MMNYSQFQVEVLPSQLIAGLSPSSLSGCSVTSLSEVHSTRNRNASNHEEEGKDSAPSSPQQPATTTTTTMIAGGPSPRRRRKRVSLFDELPKPPPLSHSSLQKNNAPSWLPPRAVFSLEEFSTSPQTTQPQSSGRSVSTPSPTTQDVIHRQHLAHQRLTPNIIQNPLKAITRNTNGGSSENRRTRPSANILKEFGPRISSTDVTLQQQHLIEYSRRDPTNWFSRFRLQAKDEVEFKSQEVKNKILEE
eukprot:scaffold4752_cov113-Cylindrotheca_fusiformis.AAC.4